MIFCITSFNYLTKVGIICQLGNLLMGGLRRLGGLRRVGVRAAPAIVGQVGQVGKVGQVGQVRQVGGRAERAFVRCLFFVTYSAAPARRLLFAYPSLIVRLTFGEGRGV